jgi:hypothetical protein
MFSLQRLALSADHYTSLATGNCPHLGSSDLGTPPGSAAEHAKHHPQITFFTAIYQTEEVNPGLGALKDLIHASTGHCF